ncbi:TPA: helix-turn-helix transcriptional regulator [Klebsiella quasipneumoniae subsp. quasipneumoniae]|nr:helix-turn-helix transcriptional regulator [Klebsiella quasipneumoniae subsp. quasipneumoniae]HBR1954974.1 helix-turn-helix transcriptional regulator [Klebsiella quasipneumoniae subsp. quasipneumoniae]
MIPPIMPLEWNFDEAETFGPVAGMKTQASDKEGFPLHKHPQGQLVISLKGAVSCEVAHELWVVPPQCGVWIPSNTPHSISTTSEAKLCMLYIRPESSTLPDKCCTIAISPLVRELILDITDQPSEYSENSLTYRKASILLEELATMPLENFCLPISDDPRLYKMLKALADNPDDRRTLSAWSSTLAMSHRTLARLIVKETGLTFGRWRQQLHLVIALRQLAAGESVQNVAGQLGYDSVNAFITMFKKFTGKSPGKYFQ